MVMIMTRKKNQIKNRWNTQSYLLKVNRNSTDTLDKVTIEIPDDTIPTETEKCVNNEDDDEKEITSDNEDEGVIHINIT